jgi:hypothetical protein
MPGELLFTRKDGKEYHLGDLVRLEHDEDFAQWNNLWSEQHGMLVGAIVYAGMVHEDILAEVLVDGRTVAFEWEDIEVVSEKG